MMVREIRKEIITTEAEMAEDDGVQLPTVFPTRKVRFRPRLAWLLIAALACLAVTLLLVKSKVGHAPVTVEKILLQAVCNDHYYLYAMNPDGSDMVPFIREDTWPFLVSSDGRTMVLSEKEGLYVVRADGHEKRKLAGQQAESPTLSADGRKIAFVVRNDEHATIEIHDLVRGGKPVTLAEDLPCREPALSPDGTQIVFTLPRGITRRAISI